MEYNAVKAVQVVARIVANNNYHPLHIAELSKLVFLSDLESIKRHGYPILDEPRATVNLAPVNLYTYEVIKGRRAIRVGEWDGVIEVQGEQTIEISINRFVIADHLDELSKAEIECIDAVCEARTCTHGSANIPIWNSKSNHPISLFEMMNAAGHTDPDAHCLIEAYEEQARIEAAFVKARMA